MIDVRKILAKCAAYSPARTPKESPAVAAAWAEHFAQYPHISMENALEAVRMYFNRPDTGLVEPCDISKIAREMRQDSALRKELPRAEHDGSNYGRVDLADAELSIETRELEDGDSVYRFTWDGAAHQPFSGQWFSTKGQAVQEGLQWCSRARVRPHDDISEKRVTGVEHVPGAPCMAPGCPKPSDFNEYCAKHFCLTMAAMMGLTR